MSKIFVSYSRTNAAHVQELYRDLESLGHDAWLDQDLSGGQRWWDRILESIRECDVYVLALSAAAVDSRACQSEFEYALALGKPVLPILVERDVSDGLMPPALAQLQRVDYTQADKNAFAALNRGLSSLPRAGALPAELPAPPEVPASYLFDLRTEIESGGVLTPERQEELLLQLRARLHSGHAPADLRALAERFQRRTDVLARVDRELTVFVEGLSSAASSVAGVPRPPVDRGGAQPPPPERPIAEQGATPPQGPGPSNTAPEAPSGEVNGWWWAVAVVFMFVGGVIAYFANRAVNPTTARNMLIVGIVMTFVWPILLNA